MKVFQLKLFYPYNKNAILKTIILQLILLFCLCHINAQSENTVKLKIETGVLWDWVEGRIYLSGPFLNVEPKLKTSKNTVIGLRLGAALNTQRILNSNPGQFLINNDFDNATDGSGANGNTVFSIVPTFDYYFPKSKLRPYLGLGIGYNFLRTAKTSFFRGNPTEALDLNVDNQIGFLLRGGLNLTKLVIGKIDFSKVIIGVEFNYIPKADVEISDGQKVGTINNSNIALSFGYKIGGRKNLE